MFSLFTKEIAFGAAGTGRGQGGPKSRGGRQKFIKNRKVAPSTSLRPRSRPADIKISSAPSTSLRPKARPADLKISSAPSTSLRPKARPADLNVSAETKKPAAAPVNISQARDNNSKADPVNVDQDTSSSQAVGTGGGSGVTKASKTTEENVTVQRKAKGTAKYKVAAQPAKPKKSPVKNPLVLAKKDKKGKA